MKSVLALVYMAMKPLRTKKKDMRACATLSFLRKLVGVSET